MNKRMIITADWHLREDRPRCRKDEDWIDTQRKAIDKIEKICTKYDADLFIVGDLFHRSSEFRMVRLVQKIADELEKSNISLYFLAGNHDLKYHSSLNMDSSAIGLVRSSNNCRFIREYPSMKLDAPNFDESFEYPDSEILFIHTLCFPDLASMPPNVNGTYAKELLENHPNAKWIYTGDYHHNFHYEHNGRHVINPGCLLRQASDMKNYQCGVYFVDMDKEIVEFIPIIDSEELVDDSYIVEEKERDSRIGDFVEKLKETECVSLDFLSNVEKALMNKSIDDGVKDMVRELMEES